MTLHFCSLGVCSTTPAPVFARLHKCRHGSSGRDLPGISAELCALETLLLLILGFGVIVLHC
jgi:hypothetical protein